MTTNLTDKQELFLEALFGPAKGDPLKAKKMAGYSDHTSMRTIMKGVSEDLIKEASTYIALHSVKASQKVIELLDEPTTPGASNLLAAANSLLDRAGIVKKDKLEVTVEAPTALLILPPKTTKPLENQLNEEHLASSEES